MIRAVMSVLILLQQIVEIQKRKKKLAQVTFSQGPLSQDGMSLGILQVRLDPRIYFSCH